jgi:hypothetical protein
VSSAASVFLVLDGAGQPNAVFSTREKAQAYIDAQPLVMGSLGPYPRDLTIEEMSVDAD